MLKNHVMVIHPLPKGRGLFTIRQAKKLYLYELTHNHNEGSTNVRFYSTNKDLTCHIDTDLVDDKTIAKVQTILDYFKMGTFEPRKDESVYIGLVEAEKPLQTISPEFETAIVEFALSEKY